MIKLRAAALSLALVLGAGSAGAAEFRETFDSEEAAMGAVLLLGIDGAWAGTLRDGVYQLVNGGGEGEVKYFFVRNVGEISAGAMARATVSVDVGGRFAGAYTGGGLIYRLDEQQRSYLAFIVTGDGRYMVLKRDAEGLRPEIIGAEGSVSARRTNRLMISASDAGIDFYINGVRVDGTEGAGLNGTSLGLLAIGVGQFIFDDFAIDSEDKRPDGF